MPHWELVNPTNSWINTSGHQNKESRAHLTWATSSSWCWEWGDPWEFEILETWWPPDAAVILLRSRAWEWAFLVFLIPQCGQSGIRLIWVFRPGALRSVGISNQPLCWWARGQLKEDAIIITHLITDPCYAGATHNCAAPVITTSFYRNIYPQPDEAVLQRRERCMFYLIYQKLLRISNISPCLYRLCL